MALLVAGNNPAAVKTAERNIFTATASQTTFTITQGYQAGDIDVYLNGVRLVDTEDYVANNGTTVVLNSGAAVGDSVVVVCFRPFQVADFYTKSEQDTRYVNTAGDTMSGELIAPFLTLDRRSWTTGLKIGTTSKDFAIYREWANNTNTISIGNITDGIENIRFDVNGRVTMPSQPSFYARRTAGHLSAFTGAIIFDSVRFNVGNNYSTTTGRFTAPVSGTYLFSWSALPYSTGWCEVELRKNGSEYGGRIQNRDSTSAAGDGLASKTAVVQLTVGDYVEAYALNTYAYANDGLWTTFSGHLIG
jgi:hypothetical protein